MNIENLIAVSGMSGIYRMAANRNNGLIVEDLDTGKRKFAPARRHQFTPLESIGVYTDDGDTVELKYVFRNILQQKDDNPPVEPNASPGALREYFADVLPNYDRDKVHLGDIKKIIKWFHFLNARGYLTLETEEDIKENSEEEE